MAQGDAERFGYELPEGFRMPEAPSPLRTLTGLWHETFQSMLAVGFTEDQALRFLAHWLVAQGHTPGGE